MVRYLYDHCHFNQPSGSPDGIDRMRTGCGARSLNARELDDVIADIVGPAGDERDELASSSANNARDGFLEMRQIAGHRPT